MRDVHFSSSDWQATLTCPICQTSFTAETEDLQYDEFKVSGYFFDGSARCEGKFFVQCPAKCSQGQKVLIVDKSTIPVLLQNKLRSHC